MLEIAIRRLHGNRLIPDKAQGSERRYISECWRAVLRRTSFNAILIPHKLRCIGLRFLDVPFACVVANQFPHAAHIYRLLKLS